MFTCLGSVTPIANVAVKTEHVTLRRPAALSPIPNLGHRARLWSLLLARDECLSIQSARATGPRTWPHSLRIFQATMIH